MFSKKVKHITLLLFCLLFVVSANAQKRNQRTNNIPVDSHILYIKKYFDNVEEWNVSDTNLAKYVKSLIHFVEDAPIDTVLNKIGKETDKVVVNFVNRNPNLIDDSLQIPGYYANSEVNKDIELAGLLLQKEYQERKMTAPLELTNNIDEKVNLVKPENGFRLFSDSIYVFPDSLKILEVIPDSLLETTADFERLLKIESLRKDYVEGKRLEYNESLKKAYHDSVTSAYKQKLFDRDLQRKVNIIVTTARQNNANILKAYNDSVVMAVNDSINEVLHQLAVYANEIDTTGITLFNLTNDSSHITLYNNRTNFTRLWLKNEQQDSLSVSFKNLDNKRIQILIDDGVTISRFTKKDRKDFDFASLNKNESGLTKFGNRYEVETPWRIGGDGTVSFTQTYLENWKKGGKSAFSLLFVLKGFANYSSPDNKIKWENTGEIRNGWIRPGGKDEESQKNDDKFEFTSRFGVSAFKKWYYSTEYNFNTQFFKGYQYPRSDNPEPFSAFLGPSRSFFKIGLDFKPNKEFSLFLSPLTVKNVFVKDTVIIDQTKFGVSANKRSLWVPGLNADLKFKKAFTPTISFETKYKMFINYKKPFKKFDINWESLLVMQLTDYINMRMMVHLIYDDDVLFPVFDNNDVKIGEEAKLQLKQFISVGFSYKINRQVMRTKRIR